MALNSPKSYGQVPVPGRIRAFRLIGSLAMLGLSLNLVACLVRGTFSDPAAWAPFAILSPLLALSIWICREEFITSFRSPQMRKAYLLLTQGALGLLALGFALYLFSHRYTWRLDWTAQRLFSLSDDTVQLLERLTRAGPPVEAFYLQGEDPQGEDQRQEVALFRVRVEELLKEFQNRAGGESGALRWSLLRLVEDPRQTAELAARMGIKVFTREMGESLVLLRGERIFHLPRREFYVLRQTNMGASPGLAFQGEAVIASALGSLLSEERQTIYLLEGHGEQELGALGAFGELLHRENLTLKPLDLSSGRQVPPGATALLVCGPRRALPAEEVRAIEAYLAGGGSVLALLDPVFPLQPALAQSPSGLQDLLERYGIRIRQELLTRSYRPDLLGTLLPQETLQAYPNPENASPLLGGLRLERVPVLLRFPCALAAGQARENGYLAEVLLQSPPFEQGELRTWADPAGQAGPAPTAQSVRGPLPLCVQAAPAPGSATGKTGNLPGARLIVLASSRALVDPLFAGQDGNQIFLRSCLRWLQKKERVQPPPTASLPAIDLAKIDEEQGRVLILLLVLVLPLAVACAGVVVWAVRRGG